MNHHPDYLSGEVLEILGRTPSRATKVVFYITLAMILLLLVAGFTFSYPEIITGNLVLSTSEPPVSIGAPKTGALEKLFVKEGDSVEKGQLIAVLESDADLDDVIELSNDLDKLSTLDESAIRNYSPNRSLVLGPQLQLMYEDFVSSLELVPLQLSDDTDSEALNALEAESNQFIRSNRSLFNAIESAEADIRTKKAQIKNIADLYAKNPTKEDYSKAIKDLDGEINSLNTYIAQTRSAIEKNNERIKESNTRKIQMKSVQKTGVTERIFQLGQNISSLRKAVALWKSDNVLYAPAAGKIWFYDNLELKKRIVKDEQLVAIIPPSEKEEFTGLVTIPVEGSGRVVQGQEVNLKFHRYPFLEFGAVKGTVAKIYPLSKGNAYTVEVALEKGLMTNRGKSLEYYQQMEGTAEIITENRLFAGRLFDKVRQLWR